MSHIVIIGGGNMGGAIAEGLLRGGGSRVTIKTPNPDKLLTLSADYPETLSVQSDFDIEGKVDFCILAVKPYMIKDISVEAAAFLTDKSPITLSVAAGISYGDLKKMLPEGLTILRSMPNTPVAFGAGLFGYYAPERCAFFEEVFACCGRVCYLEAEEMMHGFTALAGSGPAYIFHIIEALGLAGKEVGLSESEARDIARHMLIGAALLAQDKADISAMQLRKNVTSKAGTTEAGLKALMGIPALEPAESQITKIFKDTLAAAAARSRSLGEG